MIFFPVELLPNEGNKKFCNLYFSKNNLLTKIFNSDLMVELVQTETSFWGIEW